jgi:hypothetical protein
LKAKIYYLARAIAVLLLVCLAPRAARADFFDDMRRTFTSDIPHFFQDDIPCAFGGQPTSGARKTCKSGSAPAKPSSQKSKSGDATLPPEKPSASGDSPPDSGH